MRALGAAILMAMALAGCASPWKPACPAGQSQLRTVQLYMGAKAPM